MTTPGRDPYSDDNHEWKGLSPADPERAEVVRLAEELDRYAQALNPEYASGLADHCFIDYGSTDRQDIQTRYSFEVSRIRSEEEDSLLYGTVQGTAFIVTKVVSYQFEELQTLPSFAKELLEDGETTVAALDESDTEVGILFEQKTIVDTDGEMQREYRLAFGVGDNSILVLDESGSDTFRIELGDLGIAIPSEEENLDISFSEADLVFLRGVDVELGGEELQSSSKANHAIRRIYSKAAAALDVSPERQRTAVRDIVARLPLPAGPRTL